MTKTFEQCRDIVVNLKMVTSKYFDDMFFDWEDERQKVYDNFNTKDVDNIYQPNVNPAGWPKP